MFKQVVFTVVLCLVGCMSLSLQVIAQSNQDVKQSSNKQDISQGNVTPVTPVTQLGNEYHNSIELLQNRFRIDYAVEEITMVFFREYGSAPIVLVRPDGSKISQSSADGETVFWFDSSTYDMISIKKPMPGPWQAVGQITPESRVMVISDLALHADPLPNIIFSGEILKQTAYLTNNGVPIDYKAFRDVVELTISLSSTNNPNFNNFGAKTEIVAFFEDNGKGMDERPLDGIFTGQFNFAIADGEWIPVFTVSTPMFSREQVDPNIMLLANPIKVEVVLDGGGEGYHKLKVDAQREYVDISTLLIDGKVQYPNGDIQNFSITEMSADVREYMIQGYEYGVYRVKLTAYGNTTQGREFILDVSEYSFLSEEPEPVIVPVDAGDVVNSLAESTIDIPINSAIEKNTTSEQAIAASDDKMSTPTLVSIIVGINLFILIIGGGLIWWISLEKKPDFNFMKKSKVVSDKKRTDQKSIDKIVGTMSEKMSEKSTDKKPGFFAKIFKRQPKTPVVKNNQSNKAKSA